MWIVRWIVLALLLIVVVLFASQNAGEMANIRFLRWEVESSILAIIALSFIAGLAVWFVFSVFRILQYRSQTRAYQQENQRLKAEMASLKSSPSGEGTQEGSI